MPIDLNRLEKKLAVSVNNKVFCHVWLMKAFSMYTLYMDYYLVKDGIVYSIRGQKLIPSGDKVLDTHTEAEMIGDYDPDTEYLPVRKVYTFKQLKRKFNF